MTRFWRLLAVVLSLVVGFVAAVYPSGHAKATYETLYFVPPTLADYNYSYISTAWHFETALDWATNNTTVYSRAYGTNDSGSPTVRAYSNAYNAGWGRCDNATYLDIWNSDNDQWMATIIYVHTNMDGGFGGTDYYFSNSAVFNGGVSVATMTYGDTCTWTGYHVHEMTYEGGFGYREKNTDHYTGSEGTWHGNWEGGCWTRKFWW